MPRLPSTSAGGRQPSSSAAMESRFSTASASFSKLLRMAGHDDDDDQGERKNGNAVQSSQRVEATERKDDDEQNGDEEENESDGRDSDGQEATENDAEDGSSPQDDDDELEPADDDGDDDDEYEADRAACNNQSNRQQRTASRDKIVSSRHDPDSAHSSPSAAASTSTTPASSAPLSSSSLASFSAEMAATGLIYFSRLPPHMKPHKLRQLLSDYGQILRIYLTPEHHSLTASRRRSSTAASSSAAKRYTDGWVEFADKRVAKAVAVTLNGTTMGGRKRGYWYDDVWCCKCLKGFKWQHLTERGVMEGKGREGRRREEVGRAKREAEHYRQQMDKRKKVDAIRARREKKGGKESQERIGAESTGEPVLRTFYQRPAFPGKPLEE